MTRLATAEPADQSYHTKREIQPPLASGFSAPGSIPPKKSSCTTTEPESDHASIANYQVPRSTGLEDCIKLCLWNAISKTQNVGHSKEQKTLFV